MRKTREILEFDRVLQEIAAYAATSSAREKILRLTPSTNREEIQSELDRVDEALRICYGYGPCPIENVFEIKESVVRAQKGAILNCGELYRVAAQASAIRKARNFADFAHADNTPYFKYLISSLVPATKLEQEVNRCVSNAFTLNDDASGELKRVRRAITAKEEEIRRRLESYVKRNPEKLSDALITIRNDRLVIPVKSSYKNEFGGIIHDQSDSGQTFFIEPGDVVNVNAELQSLKRKEQQETERILRALTDIVRASSFDLLNNFTYLTTLDFLFAKARYGKDINGKVAVLSPEQEIYLIKARHPLLPRDTAVANDFTFGGQLNKTVLITGPNTGGKTVALKTIGLLATMNQAGLVIPVDFEARLGIFDNVFVDIGDDQSIEQSLSTFSSHLSKMVYITKNATDKSLVLIDELGGGTDPNEGEALAMALLDYFHRVGSLTIITTHYSNLKSFAIEKGYITNASLLFDIDAFAPLYKLVYGIPGKSYAFMISRRLGLDENIVAAAENYETAFQSESDALIDKLQKDLEAMERAKKEAAAQEEILREKLAEADKNLAEAKKAKRDLQEQARDRIQSMVDEATERIDEIIKETTVRPTSDIKLHEWIAMKKKLGDLTVFEIDEDKRQIFDYRVGETVFVPRLNKSGTVTRKKGDSYVVSVGKVSLDLKAKELAKRAQVKPRSQVEIKAPFKTTPVGMECNIIGKRVDEGLVIVAKYLDDALLMHYHEARIIHGCGTGALRKAVHKFLDEQKFVKSYRLGGAGEGGVGATIVYFK